VDDLVVMGDAAVKAATEAIANQIGITAQRIATSIDAQTLAKADPGKLGVDSVEVSFGVTLSGGVQALFTAQAESSAQVTVALTRRPS
jgi:Trypsin-co-occurring domain 1